MPPDVAAAVRKFIPNNTRLANLVTKVCDQVFRARTLPLQLVKLMVNRAFEESRKADSDITSRIFEEKLVEYANAIKPRFMSQLLDLQRQGKKW